MITLKLPFRAKDIEGLFNKVCKGQYSRIPDNFSDDLFQIVQFLLQIEPNSRPSCEQILNHPIVMKRIEDFKSIPKEDETEDILLKTICMPKNLLFLSERLPKPNYDKRFKSLNNPIENSSDRNILSFYKDNNNRGRNNTKEIFKNISGENIKRPLQLKILCNKIEEKEKLNSIQNYNLKNNEDNKQSSIASTLIRNKYLFENKIGLKNVKINHELNKIDLISLKKIEEYII